MRELGCFGVLSCVRLMCAAMCAQSAVWHVCVGCRVVLRASDGLGTASRPPVRVCRSSERCASCYETAGLSEILSGPYNVKLLNARAGDMYLWHMYEH